MQEDLEVRIKRGHGGIRPQSFRCHSRGVRIQFHHSGSESKPDKVLSEFAAAFFSGIPPLRINTGHGAGAQAPAGPVNVI